MKQEFRINVFTPHGENKSYIFNEPYMVYDKIKDGACNDEFFETYDYLATIVKTYEGTAIIAENQENALVMFSAWVSKIDDEIFHDECDIDIYYFLTMSEAIKKYAEIYDGY